MSHVPGNLIFKRWLNALKSPSGKVNPNPPGGVLTIFDGETNVPVPPNTVMGFAETVRNNFLTFTTLTVSVDCETFEEFEAATSITAFGPTPNGVSCTMDFDIVTSGNFNGRFNTTPAGAIFGELPSFTGVTITFSENLAGFGFFATDMGDFNAQWSVDLTDENDVVTTYEIGHSVGTANGNLEFWGFTDSTGLLYKSIRIYSDNSADGAGIDDIYLVRSSDLAT